MINALRFPTGDKIAKSPTDAASRVDHRPPGSYPAIKSPATPSPGRSTAVSGSLDPEALHSSRPDPKEGRPGTKHNRAYLHTYSETAPGPRKRTGLKLEAGRPPSCSFVPSVPASLTPDLRPLIPAFRHSFTAAVCAKNAKNRPKTRQKRECKRLLTCFKACFAPKDALFG